MKNELAVTEQYLQKNVSVIQKQFNLNQTDLQFFLIQCQRTGLDPITKQIYAIPASGGKINIMASIDGLRLIAERSGLYKGQTKAEWCDDDGKWTDVWLKSTYPKAARVGVKKTGFDDPLFATAMFIEYAGASPGFMWKKMPALMISKVAEALALRKAFPNEMSGVYASEEIQHENQETPKARDVGPKLNTHVPWQGILETTVDDIPENQITSELSPEVQALAKMKIDHSEHELTIGLSKGKLLKDLGPDAVFEFVNKMWLNSKVTDSNIEEIRILEQYLIDVGYKHPSFKRDADDNN